MTAWRVDPPCADCPFNEAGPGRRLRDSLYPGRFAAIKRALRAEQSFHCHKTTRETGNGTALICGGSLRWKTANRVRFNQYEQIAERLEPSR